VNDGAELLATTLLPLISPLVLSLAVGVIATVTSLVVAVPIALLTWAARLAWTAPGSAAFDGELVTATELWELTATSYPTYEGRHRR
jgi:ABC-type spermidine/putrescine transport system permease subunit II